MQPRTERQRDQAIAGIKDVNFIKSLKIISNVCAGEDFAGVLRYNSCRGIIKRSSIFNVTDMK